MNAGSTCLQDSTWIADCTAGAVAGKVERGWKSEKRESIILNEN